MRRILLVEDDASLRSVMSYHLRKAGYEVEEAPEGACALEAVAGQAFDLVLTDVRMPKMNGLDLLRQLRARDLDLPVVMLTAFGTIHDAVEAMRAGACDYLTKPVEKEQLLHAVDRALRLGDLERENRRLREELAGQKPLEAIMGTSPALQDVLTLLRQVGPSDATILITGESGTGKELAARALHELSPRAQAPFVALNCAAVPADLLESELFGYRKGAFTGAAADHRGKFQQADGGTLFLDEISDMDIRLQAKILRVIQERVIDPLGGAKPLPVDVRLIAATNRELQLMVAEGKFREDLYYRLNVIRIHLPPLRDRGEDALILLAHYYRHFGGGELTLHPMARQALHAYGWPGNVREVVNLGQRLAVLHPRQVVQVGMLPVEMAEATGAGLTAEIDASRGLRAMERDAVYQALVSQHWNQAAAARALGIPRHILIYRMKKYNITRP